MRTAQINLPEGNPDAQAVLEHELLHTWGGYTHLVGNGAWLSPFDGKVYKEPVSIYLVAADDRGFGQRRYNNARLNEIAREVGRLANQDAVYVMDFDGEVTILDTRKKEDVA